MASLLKLTHTGYRNIERGKTELTLSKIIQIANYLEVSYLKLLSFENGSQNNASGLDKLNTDFKHVGETNKQLLQHYKEEIIFLRKQIEFFAAAVS